MAVCLIVDDDDLSCEMSSHTIMSLGISTTIKTDSVEALTWCARNMPDLILLDIRMPKIDGFAFIKAFHKIPNSENTKIIASTGLCDVATVHKLKTERVSGYLVKPYSMDALKERVAQLKLY